MGLIHAAAAAQDEQQAGAAGGAWQGGSLGAPAGPAASWLPVWLRGVLPGRG